MRVPRTLTVLKILGSIGSTYGVDYAPQVVIGYCAIEHKNTGRALEDIVTSIPDLKSIGRSDYIRYCSWACRACKVAIKSGLVCSFYYSDLPGFTDNKPKRPIACYSMTPAGYSTLKLSEEV